MKREDIKKLIEETKIKLGISDKIRLELRPMKIKAASISLERGVIRLNKSIMPKLDDNSIRYLVLHELLHYKRGTIYHGNGFYMEISDYMKPADVERAENLIIQALLELNGIKRANKERKGLTREEIW